MRRLWLRWKLYFIVMGVLGLLSSGLLLGCGGGGGGGGGSSQSGGSSNHGNQGNSTETGTVVLKGTIQ